MYLKIAVESIFWTFILQMFFFFISSTSGTMFKGITFTLFGFLIIYFSMFMVLVSLKY
ncbi:MAG TPA: hypothetical protein VJH23_05355 [archaeon]|nr:hypothetical protein [archaeon]